MKIKYLMIDVVRKDVLKIADKVIEERINLLKKLAEEHKHIKR
jgi:hypothetical protein